MTWLISFALHFSRHVLAGIKLIKFMLKDYIFFLFIHHLVNAITCFYKMVWRFCAIWAVMENFFKVFSHLSIYLGFGYKFLTKSLNFPAPYPAMHGLEFDLQTKFCIQCHNQRNVWILCHVYIWHHSQWNIELFELMYRCMVLMFPYHIQSQWKPWCQPKHICKILSITYLNQM